jgi:hypothetical protein
MSDPSLPAVLPTGTRYTSHGVEYELLGPSALREDGTYPVPARRYVASGYVSPAPVEGIAACQSLELVGPVVLPEAATLDPYAEHRRKIGDDK